MGRWIVRRRGTFILSVILAGTLLCPGWTKHGIALADQKAEASAPREEMEAAASGEAVEYHTPLAGEPLHIVYMGESIDIPALDRSHVTAMVLGGEFYTPKQGDTSAPPRLAASI